VRQSTLPKRQCAVPDASVVPISARWTVAEAIAGAAPAARSRRRDAIGHPERAVDELGDQPEDSEYQELLHGVPSLVCALFLLE
jgi:hypothetical protein